MVIRILILGKNEIVEAAPKLRMPKIYYFDLVKTGSKHQFRQKYHPSTKEFFNYYGNSLGKVFNGIQNRQTPDTQDIFNVSFRNKFFYNSFIMLPNFLHNLHFEIWQHFNLFLEFTIHIYS